MKRVLESNVNCGSILRSDINIIVVYFSGHNPTSTLPPYSYNPTNVSSSKQYCFSSYLAGYTVSGAFFNPLRPNSADLSQTSHCNIKGLSVWEVMRIENTITSVKLY